jgi:hypothetical protein
MRNETEKKSYKVEMWQTKHEPYCMYVMAESEEDATEIATDAYGDWELDDRRDVMYDAYEIYEVIEEEE